MAWIYFKTCAGHTVELGQWRLCSKDGLSEQPYSVLEYLVTCYRIVSVSPRVWSCSPWVRLFGAGCPFMLYDASCSEQWGGIFSAACGGQGLGELRLQVLSALSGVLYLSCSCPPHLPLGNPESQDNSYKAVVFFTFVLYLPRDLQLTADCFLSTLGVLRECLCSAVLLTNVPDIFLLSWSDLLLQCSCFWGNCMWPPCPKLFLTAVSTNGGLSIRRLLCHWCPLRSRSQQRTPLRLPHVSVGACAANTLLRVRYYSRTGDWHFYGCPLTQDLGVSHRRPHDNPCCQPLGSVVLWASGPLSEADVICGMCVCVCICVRVCGGCGCSCVCEGRSERQVPRGLLALGTWRMRNNRVCIFSYCPFEWFDFHNKHTLLSK